jgi:threonine/homoserine/homoserine lactone efflux protein
MLTFAAALSFLIITPGIGVLTTAGIGAGYGVRAGLRFLVGLFIGTNLAAILVVTGIAAVVLADPIAGPVLFYGSLAYLLYLAVRIGWAGAKIAFIHRASAPGVLGGIVLQLDTRKNRMIWCSLGLNGSLRCADDLGSR